MSGLFIADGYMLDGKLPAHKGTPALGFRYRPALPEQVAEYWFRNNRSANGKEQIEHITAFIAGQIISWDAKQIALDKTETSVPATPEWIKKLPYPLLIDLRDEILSFGTGDPSPAESSAKN